MRKYKIGDRVRRLESEVSSSRPINWEKWTGTIVAYQEMENEYRVKKDNNGFEVVWNEKNFESWNKLKETLK